MTTATETLVSIATSIDHRLTEVERSLDADRRRRETKRARISEVAIEEGDANSINSSLDDLLVEFGLHARPIKTSVQFNVFFEQDFSAVRYSLRTGSDDVTSHVAQTGASNPFRWGHPAGRRESCVNLHWTLGLGAEAKTPREDGEPDCVCPEVDEEGFVVGDVLPENIVGVSEMFKQPPPAGVTRRFKPHRCFGEGCRNLPE